MVSKTELQIALKIPEALVANIDAYADEYTEETTIGRKVVPEAELDLEDQLGFDPITGSEIIWLAVHIVGPAAINIGLGLISNAVYDYLKESASEGQMYEVRVQTEDGASYSLRSDRVLDVDQLEIFLRAAASD